MASDLSVTEEKQQKVRDELDRVLASDSFARASRVSELLRYLVGEALAGRADRIKAFTVAQDVFNRDERFNQQRDPIVRVEASRLRKCLTQYYEALEQEPEVRIEIPVGSYSPSFTFRTTTAKPIFGLRPSVIISLILTAVVMLWLGWQMGDQRPTSATYPTHFLAVLPLSVSNEDAGAQRLANSLVESTITQLARLPGLSVMAHTSVIEFQTRQINISSLRSEFGVTHVLRGNIETRGEDVHVQVQLVDTTKSETIWAHQLSGIPLEIESLREKLIEELANALELDFDGGIRKIVLSRYTENEEANGLYRQGLFMILPANETERVITARRLFQRVQEIDPEFAGGYTGEAWSHSLPVLFQTSSDPQTDLARSETLARRAIDHDPGFAAAYAVLGFTQALAGRGVESLDNTRVAGALEPGDPLVQLLRGVSLIIAGLPEESFAPLDEAFRLNPAELRAPYLNVQAIGKVANREYEQALEIIQKNISRGGPHGPHMDIFRAAALTHLNRLEDARLVVEDLNSNFPNYRYKGWLAYWLPDEEHFTETWNKLSALGLLSQSKSTEH